MTVLLRTEVDTIRVAIYGNAVMSQIPRLLGSMDREISSPTAGCCDREHWSWKFRDFPIGMAQMAMYPLALCWRHRFPDNPYLGNDQLLHWIESAIRYTLGRQHANGSFDSVAPWTQDHGVSLQMAYGLTETMFLLGDALPNDLVRDVSHSVDRACHFGLRSTEDYAFISNHQAMFALAFWSSGTWLGERSFVERSEQIVEAIVERQSAEGWYLEYGGPDPGYDSLGIFYLAMLWQRTGSETLLASLARAVNFFSHFVHPDGSVGGVYGSRHTQLYFPGGFEILSESLPLAASVATFMRARLASGNVVTPATSDVENLTVLAYCYLESCFGSDPTGDLPPLPCQSLEGVRRFSASGLVAAGSRRYYAVMSTSKGGVCRVFEKERSRLAYEDAGYCVRLDRSLATSQLIGLGHEIKSDIADVVCCETEFAEACQEMLTPAKFVLLRLLNLTVFRSLMLGAWVRRRILARLILRKRLVPLRLRRRVTFMADEVRIHDRLELIGTVHPRSIDLARTFTGIHMGSAKYFHASELEPVSMPVVERLLDQLNKDHAANVEWAIHFSTDSPAAASIVSDTVVPT